MSNAALLKIFLVSLGILLSACKADGQLDEQQGAGDAPRVDAPVAVSGRVVSGFPSGAEVRFLAGSADSRAIGPKVTTDMGGHFQISLESKYLFMPVVIETAIIAGKTVLTCTSMSGCSEGTDFGEVYTATESETIYAAVPLLRRNEAYNVSRLTDLAYQRAGAQRGDGDAWADPVATLNQQMTFERENSRVASRFSVIGKLSSFVTADFTSAAEVSVSGSDALYYSALDAAIVEASKDKYRQPSSVIAYQQFAQEFGQLGIADSTDSESVVSYVDIIAKLISFFRLQNAEIEAISLLQNELSAARAVALSGRSDQYELGTSSVALGLTSLEKSKLFVKSIRQVASSVDLNKITSLSDVSGFVDGKAGDALDAFNLKLDAAEILSGEEPAYLRKAVVRTAKAVTRAALAFYFDEGGSVIVEDGIAVKVTDLGDEVEFAVDEVITVCETPRERCAISVGVRATFRTDRLTGTAGVTEGALAANALAVTFSGSLSNERLSITFAPGQKGLVAEKFYMSMRDTVEGGATGFSVYFTAEKLSVHFRAMLARLDMPEQISVNTLIELDSDEIAAEFSENESTEVTDGGVLVHHLGRSLVIDDMARLDARGGMVILRGDEEGFLAGASGTTSKPEDMGVVVYSTNKTSECIDEEPEKCMVLSDESTLEGESDDRFVALNLSTSFKANLAGVVKPVQVQISSMRESSTSNKIGGLKVAYPGHALSLNGQFNNKGGITSMNATNLDGMEMFIKTGEVGKRYGDLSGPDGDSVGEIIDMGEWIMIRYPDGNFVSM